MKFHTKYNPPKSPGVKFDRPSLTDVSQQSDCDINRIIDRYRETGYLVDPMHPGTRKPLFGDFSCLPDDYQSALDLIDRADDAFASLPAKVRDRFANDPSKIFEFLQDEKNREEAISLGLIEKPQVSEDLKSSEKKSIPPVVEESSKS